MVDPDTSPLITPARLIAAASVLTGLILIIAQPAAGATTAGLTVFVITFWAVNVIPAYLSALIFMLLAVVLNAAPPEVVFAGFTSAAFWLVFGGLIIGAAIEHTGLAERIAQGIAGRLRASYPLLIAGLVVLGIVLAFLMPSSVGRVVLLTPILMALTESLGFQRGSSGHTGILLAGICGTVLPSYGILTANVPNVVLAGAAESVHGIMIGYSEYLLAHFPVLSLLRGAFIVGLVTVLFPDRLPEEHTAELSGSRLSGQQRLLLVLLVVALALWLTDAVHGIAAAWVAAGTGLLIVLTGILPAEKMHTAINYPVLFFVAGIISVGEVLSTSPWMSVLAQAAETVLPMSPGAELLNFFTLAGTATVLSIIGTTPTVPALITPVAAELAAATGFSIRAIVLLQTVGMGLLIFPHQAPPIVVALALSDLRFEQMLRFLLLLAAATIVFMLPLDFLWWQLLGWI